jgi:hypothetical protein
MSDLAAKLHKLEERVTKLEAYLKTHYTLRPRQQKTWWKRFASGGWTTQKGGEKEVEHNTKRG